MKILITADLHYDIARSRSGACELAERACREGGDALVLIGDTAGRDPEPLRQCLRLFSGFTGKRLLVMGNHCLWCRPHENSMYRYDTLIPEIAAAEGFGVLDHESAVMQAKPGTVPSPAPVLGLVGSIGWYDYAFADPALEVPQAFYEAKVAPGAANYFEEHRHLVEAHRHLLTERHLEMSSRWMDGVHVRLGMSDADFVRLLADKLRKHLEQVASQVERIVAFTHHVPFRELIPTDRPDRFAFAAAYMGSPAIGEVLLACPKVTHVYCGHSHWPGECQIGHVRVVNVGSTYTEKRMVTLDV